MRNYIDINCDLGEQAELNIEFLHKILPSISSANISCGTHAGNQKVIQGTIALASEKKCAIGAHPSYPDRENFGRKSMPLNQQAFNNMLTSQLEYFYDLCASENAIIHHIKPHGALYNDLAKSETLSMWFIEFIMSYDANIKVYGLAHSIFHALAIKHKVNFISEGFLDRRYTKDLKLKPRSETDAVITDAADVIAQLNGIIEGYLFIDENKVNINVDTICLHGDTPGADVLASNIFNHLNERGIEITAA